jgi:hypothetical protein
VACGQEHRRRERREGEIRRGEALAGEEAPAVGESRLLSALIDKRRPVMRFMSPSSQGARARSRRGVPKLAYSSIACARPNQW